jgi:hypothetical protein
MSKGKYYFSKSLEKGLKILALFNRATPVFTQSEIARNLGLNTTSTYRYINTLVELGYLEKDTKTKEIRPSSLCLLFCTNLMRATDHLRMIKEVVDRIHGENNISYLPSGGGRDPHLPSAGLFKKLPAQYGIGKSIFIQSPRRADC